MPHAPRLRIAAATAALRDGGASKERLHPRNRHREAYDFRRLCAAHPPLRRHVAVNAHGNAGIDFADPQAVLALNAALLAVFYGVARWELPPGFLCPPVPGRADHLHHLADLLASDRDGAVPRGAAVRVLDIGVGANLIYPLIGHREYGWTFVGSECHAGALASARRIIAGNPGLAQAITLRHQPRRDRILEGVIAEGERFDLILCNPPFHASAQEAAAGTRTKLRHLGRDGRAAPALNFGGQAQELWCPGGESAFVGALIRDSARHPTSVRWCSALIAKGAHLPGLQRVLAAARAREVRILDLAQGQKRSRILAWSFLDAAARRAWAGRR